MLVLGCVEYWKGWCRFIFCVEEKLDFLGNCNVVVFDLYVIFV